MLGELQTLQTELNGNYARNEIGEKGNPALGDRMFAIYRGIERSTYGPTTSHNQQLQIVKNQISSALAQLKVSQLALDALYEELQNAGAPYVEN